MSTKEVKVKKIKLSRDARQNIIVGVVFIFMMVLFGSLSEYFLKPNNMLALLVAMVPLGLIGIAQTCNMITGVFDLSVGMVASLAGVLWTWLITKFGVPIYAAFAVALVFGVISGAIVGFAVAYLHMPAWIASYAVMQLWNGLIFVITDGVAIRMTKYKAFKWLGQYKLFGIDFNPAVVIMLLAFVVMFFVLRYTKFGRDLFIIGGNVEAAKNVGVKIKPRQMTVLTLCGFWSALAGCLFASRSGSGQPVIGELYSMQAIAGSVIGGTLMTGGKANLAMTFVGVLMMVVLQNGLIMIGVPAFYQHIATGAAVVLAIFVQTERKK